MHQLPNELAGNEQHQQFGQATREEAVDRLVQEACRPHMTQFRESCERKYRRQFEKLKVDLASMTQNSQTLSQTKQALNRTFQTLQATIQTNDDLNARLKVHKAAHQEAKSTLPDASRVPSNVVVTDKQLSTGGSSSTGEPRHSLQVRPNHGEDNDHFDENDGNFLPVQHDNETGNIHNDDAAISPTGEDRNPLIDNSLDLERLDKALDKQELNRLKISSPTLPYHRWTPQEDKLLERYKGSGLTWEIISEEYLPSRSAAACIARVTRLRDAKRSTM